MTRFAKIHPYPAMISDEVAAQIAKDLGAGCRRVLDPFCGTGRTLVAFAELGATAIGVDVNPLATMLVAAKAASPKPDALRRIVKSALFWREKTPRMDPPPDLNQGRRVRWFSSSAEQELGSILNWLNSIRIRKSELLLVSAALSATVREVSYCRKDQWKLHRLSAEARQRFQLSPWTVFERRMESIIATLHATPSLPGSCRAITGDSRNLRSVLLKYKVQGKFDAIITSPPYGDSLSTVQYGGISGICLNVIRHIKRLNLERSPTGRDIDNRCLGGGGKTANIARNVRSRSPRKGARITQDVSRYWAGANESRAKRQVERFLSDVAICCRQLDGALKKDGRAVIVVARRNVAGARVLLDRFFAEELSCYRWTLESSSVRQIQHKLTPAIIHRRGKVACTKPSARTKDRVQTMQEEITLHFRKG